MQVEIWSDVVCPWCYLGKRRFESALEGFAHNQDVEVVYRSFELDPNAPRDTTKDTVAMLADKYGMSAEQANDAQRQMEHRAHGDGLEFHLDGLRSGNTRDAHRLLQLARVRHVQEAMAERLHHAYFTEQRSVFDHASLRELATDAGLDPTEVDDVLAGDAYDAEVRDDEELARSFGAGGVPFFVFDRRYAISGAQPIEAISETLVAAWGAATTRPR